MPMAAANPTWVRLSWSGIRFSFVERCLLLAQQPRLRLSIADPGPATRGASPSTHFLAASPEFELDLCQQDLAFGRFLGRILSKKLPQSLFTLRRELGFRWTEASCGRGRSGVGAPHGQQQPVPCRPLAHTRRLFPGDESTGNCLEEYPLDTLPAARPLPDFASEIEKVLALNLNAPAADPPPPAAACVTSEARHAPEPRASSSAVPPRTHERVNAAAGSFDASLPGRAPHTARAGFASAPRTAHARERGNVRPIHWQPSDATPPGSLLPPPRGGYWTSTAVVVAIVLTGVIGGAGTVFTLESLKRARVHARRRCRQPDAHWSTR